VIVCQCQVITDRDVCDAVDNGARTLSSLCKSTGAGRDCAACVFSLKRLLCEHKERNVSPVPEVESAAS